MLRAYLFSFTLKKVEFATYMNFPVQGKLWFEIGSGRLELFFVVIFFVLLIIKLEIESIGLKEVLKTI